MVTDITSALGAPLRPNCHAKHIAPVRAWESYDHKEQCMTSNLSTFAFHPANVYTVGKVSTTRKKCGWINTKSTENRWSWLLFWSR